MIPLSPLVRIVQDDPSACSLEVLFHPSLNRKKKRTQQTNLSTQKEIYEDYCARNMIHVDQPILDFREKLKKFNQKSIPSHKDRVCFLTPFLFIIIAIVIFF